MEIISVNKNAPFNQQPEATQRWLKTFADHANLSSGANVKDIDMFKFIKKMSSAGKITASNNLLKVIAKKISSETFIIYAYVNDDTNEDDLIVRIHSNNSLNIRNDSSQVFSIAEKATCNEFKMMLFSHDKYSPLHVQISDAMPSQFSRWFWLSPTMVRVVPIMIN